MSEPTPPTSNDEDPGPAKTPFDNPWFLPVMLWLFTAWFGWDAWVVPMEEHLAFNRYGFFVVLALAIWFSWKAVKEQREESDSDSAR
jgi:hypothetical protein